MDNRELFDELNELVRQPGIWFTAMSLNSGRNSQRPDNSRRLLRVLSTTKEPLTAGAIADILDVRPASVTMIIKKLEADDYVQRVKDENDARVVLVQITEAGLEHLQDLDETRENFESSVFDVFDEDEREQFGASLRKLNEHVSSDEFMQQMTDKMGRHQKQMYEHLQKSRNQMNNHLSRGLQHAAKHRDEADGNPFTGWFK